MTPNRPIVRRRRTAAPQLLGTFVAATLVVVLAVVAIGRTGSYWADAVAVALLLGLVGLLMLALQRLLRDEGPAGSDDAAAARRPGA